MDLYFCVFPALHIHDPLLDPDRPISSTVDPSEEERDARSRGFFFPLVHPLS